VLYQRTTERRRREREGLPPLPGLWESLQQWMSGSSRADTSAETSAAPLPDLDMLTADLPQPDLGAMMGDSESPAPVDLADEFELPPQPAPVYDEEPPAAAVALDVAYDEESIPVQPDEMEVTDDMPAPPDSIELLRVWRDLSDGSLIIEIGGQRFTSVSELQGTNLDRRFMNVVRDLTAMLRTAAEPPPKAAPKPAPPLKAAATAPPAEEETDEPDQPAKKLAPPPVNGELPSMAPGTMFKQMGRVAMGYKPEPLDEAPALSIPDQIEQVLQKHLADLPEYADRSIHVRPSPFGGVRIEVDGQFYEGVGDVADEKVRALIQSAVQEWEQHQ
jgi:hypothetical protein